MEHSFTSWLHRRKTIDDLMPEGDKLLLVIAQAGQAGMTRKEIGSAIDLGRPALDSLLAGLVRLGVLTLMWRDGIQAFRSTGAS